MFFMGAMPGGAVPVKSGCVIMGFRSHARTHNLQRNEVEDTHTHFVNLCQLLAVNPVSCRPT